MSGRRQIRLRKIGFEQSKVAEHIILANHTISKEGVKLATHKRQLDVAENTETLREGVFLAD